MPRLDLCLGLILAAAPALADPLAGMAGNWSGSGWARQSASGPQERIRCRMTNDYEAERRRLRIRGTCAVPGRKLTLDGAIMLQDDGRVGGFWRNPLGVGETSLSGTIEGDTIYVTFRAPDPDGDGEIAQIVRWRVADKGLSMVSQDRGPGATTMSDIEFSR